MILNTEAERERTNLINRVFHLDKVSYVYGNVDANISMVYDAIESSYESFMKWDIHRIHEVVIRFVQNDRLIRNQNYVQVFETVLGTPEYSRKSGVYANDMLLVEYLIKNDWPCTLVTVSQAVIDLWDQLADNADYRDNTEASDRRNAQINEMTKGGTSGFSIQCGPRKYAYDKDGRTHDPNRGMSQGSGSMALKGAWSHGAGKPFSAMSNEEVASLYAEWKTTSDLRSMSVEQLREIVKNKSNPYGTKPSLQLPHVAAPDSQDRLYHPQTSEPLDQRSLIAFINQAPYNGRNLITRNGRIVKRLRELFEATIRGELG